MLEDDFTYVLKKALRGLALSSAEAADKAGISEQKVTGFSRGHFEPRTARHLAEALDLSPEAYATHLEYHPEPIHLPYVRRLILPFHEDHVNAWLISKGDYHLLFDTGNDENSASRELSSLGLELSAVFITHGHPDHISGMAAFQEQKFGPLISGATHLDAGARIKVGEIKLTTVDLSGHFIPALGYVIGGFDRPLLVAGDAIFAGSIGGCDPEHYRSAIDNIKTVLEKLDDRTVILPGHGPATTVGEEKRRNPFLA